VSLAGLLAAAASGCVSPPRPIEGIVEGTEHGDIPVPPDFEFTGSQERPPLEPPRSWTGYYRGSRQISDLAPWYIPAMQAQGWSFQGIRDGDADSKRLRFYKGDEEAYVELYRDFDSRKGRYTTVIKASIHPRGPETRSVAEHLGLAEESVSIPAQYPRNPPRSEPRGFRPAAVSLEPAGEARELDPIDGGKQPREPH
jgi:hypothetical protein